MSSRRTEAAGRDAVVADGAQPGLPRGGVVREGRDAGRSAEGRPLPAPRRGQPDDRRRPLTREAIWRFVTPRWRRHLERLVERGRPDAVLVFTVPMALRGIPTRCATLRPADRLLRRRRADEPARVRRHGHRLQLLPRRRPRRYDLVVSNSEGGSRACSSSAHGRPRAVFWAADPDFFTPQPVAKTSDVFFYGYGDKFRREWMGARRRAVAGAAGGRLRARRARLPGRHGAGA